MYPCRQVFTAGPPPDAGTSFADRVHAGPEGTEDLLHGAPLEGGRDAAPEADPEDLHARVRDDAEESSAEHGAHWSNVRRMMRPRKSR